MSLRVLFITSEIDDFVRVGGLAAVSATLPRALKPWTDVRVLVPGYRDVLSQLSHLEVVGACPALAELPPCSLGLAETSDGIPIYVVICPELYERQGSPYCDESGKDWADNDLRFARLASAGARLAAGSVDRNWHADLVHANDWQSALVPAYLAWHSCPIPTILTIHNLAFQGLFAADTLRKIGAPDCSFHIGGLEFYGKVSFLKAGLVYATHLTTVSETYAREITTPELGCGLDGVLRKRSAANELTGIINGIDGTWDSQTCRELPVPFGSGDWKSKRANTDHLRRQFGLALSRGPLFGLVARLVHQKGVDLVLAAAETIVESGGQIVVMGRGEPELEQALQSAQMKHRKSIAAAIRFDHGEARRIFAGSDFTLLLSRFEPCGLSQMYAQRFGSLPIGHRTGGLAETIKDGRTGFLFSQPSAESFMGAICRAFGTFASKRRLNLMRSDAMAQTFGWGSSASSYRHLYGKLAGV
ncbi:MAG TPA: glycogen synthase GlgA [Xanthobacteraceae bacterium]|nr:glycogen synthase GlgA [Xanthobacteraceae bacterium]